MGIEQKVARNEVSPQHWQGPKEGQSMDEFLVETAVRINATWQEEYQRMEGQPLRFESFQGVAQKVGYFSQAVVETTIQWIREGDAKQREIGGVVAMHHFLHPILAAVERAREKFPQLNFDALDVLNWGLSRLLEKIEKAETDKLASTLNTATFNEAARMVASRLNVPVDWVKDGIVEYIQKHLGAPEEINRALVVEEIRRRFDLHSTTEHVLRLERFGPEWTVSDKEVVGDLVSDRPDLLEKVKQRLDAPTDLTLLREELDRALSSLSPREAFILRERFGLGKSVEPRTRESLAKELGLGVDRIRQIETLALRKLRYPSRGRPLRDYLY